MSSVHSRSTDSGPCLVEVDTNGSPVTIDPADWLVCFVPGLQRQWWHRFAHPRHKHVFAMRPVGDGNWLLVEPWWRRLMVNVLSRHEAVKFLDWAAAGDVLQVRESIPGQGSQMRGWSNCAVVMAFLLGRAYWTWTPHGLFRRLLADCDVKVVDPPSFLAEHLRSEAVRCAEHALDLAKAQAAEPLDQRLQKLGIGIVAAISSSASVSLLASALCKDGRFGNAAAAYWARGPQRALDGVRKELADSRERGEIVTDDCELASRQFVAMLVEDLIMQLMLGLRAAPTPMEIHRHVLSVVSIFLGGAVRPRRPVRQTSAAESLKSDPEPSVSARKVAVSPSAAEA